MLKRYYYSALFTIFILFVLCLGNGIYMENLLKTAEEYAQSAFEYAIESDFENVCVQVDKLEDYWYQYRNYLESILPHNVVDDATETILHFVSAGSCGDMDSIIRIKSLLSEELDHLTEMEMPSFHNIF